MTGYAGGSPDWIPGYPMPRSGEPERTSLEPHCSKCVALEKQCEYAASRRGGLDRATLLERRKRIAKEKEPRLDISTPQPTGTYNDVIISSPYDQPVIILDPMDHVIPAALSDETSTLTAWSNLGANVDSLTEDPLIISYYTNFHHLHPFAPPLQHFVRLCQQTQEPSLDFNALVIVMRLIGHLYTAHEWSHTLQSHCETRISQLPSSDPVRVQCKLLYSIALFWNNFRVEADREMETAKNIALSLGMHRKEFATANGAGDGVLIESWRRTWWMLVFHIEASVELPCEEADYESGIISQPRTLEEFNSREFSDDDIEFSSFAYLIGAVKCAALAISASPKYATRKDSEHIIQSADSVTDAWLLLLPKRQKPVMRNDGAIDELMFQANMLVHVFNPVESASSCAREPPPDIPKPDLINVHTTRILKSVNAQIQLLALPVRPFHHTPFTTCMMSEGTLALLSACKYLLQGKALAIARDQIRLSIACLKSLAEVWPRTARNVKEIQTIARHVLGTKGGNTATGTTPSSSEPSSLTGSGGQPADDSIQIGDMFASLGSFEDICGWFNMSPEANFSI
ncbi:C6 transcription factor [Fusarium heterosporum]|uniref:C6 transcription factor n=1 Tax=Fusarium heterosporum TaxID=42747 RepID=A0A8H5U1U9_FUSHE|nr:C6 transcription factor [Fusarium heterosporum]